MKWEKLKNIQFEEIDQSRTGQVVFLLLFLLVLMSAFALSPLVGGDDWETFQGASLRILSGSPLYGEKVTHAYYSNPPWVALLLIPFALLPHRLGWVLISALNLFIVTILSRRWSMGVGKLVLTLFSPATFYLLLHGEIDAIVLGGVLLPQEAWILVGLTKPQVAIGLVFGIKKEKILRSVFITIVVIAASLLLFGPWPLEVIRQPVPFVDALHNLWVGLWPFQVPLGIGLLLVGIRRSDERLLLAASPFLSPYAALSSMLGPWMALSSYLRFWESLVVFVVWWGAVIYRLLGI